MPKKGKPLPPAANMISYTQKWLESLKGAIFNVSSTPSQRSAPLAVVAVDNALWTHRNDTWTSLNGNAAARNQALSAAILKWRGEGRRAALLSFAEIAGTAVSSRRCDPLHFSCAMVPGLPLAVEDVRRPVLCDCRDGTVNRRLSSACLRLIVSL
jgi:hypothetical protein